MESERCQSDTAATTRILGRHSPFLRHLELSSGLTSVRHLATTTWPVLQTLILTGPCPSHREPILQIMQAMPALRDLQIMYAICPPRYISFCVCLPNSVTEITTSSTLTLATCSPALQSMTLSNPHSADAVWRGIPRSLESLTLLSIYEWPHKTVGIDIAYATRIVRHVSTCGARLRELRIFVNSEPTVDLIDTIVRHFPALQTLHVGMDVWPRGARQDIDISLLVRNSNNFFSLSSTIRQEEYVQALLPLLALRELYLGLILPESAYVYAFASVFCHRLPSLEVVGIQQVDASAFYHPARIEWWATYVTRGRNGLRYHDICEPLLS
jgi:hypothetical protein